jgi:SAM-dependent methyltransferase
VIDHGVLTDKGTLGYHAVYEELLAGRPHPAILEIGTAYGGSLLMWRDLAPEGVIVGVDLSRPDELPRGVVFIQERQQAPELPGLVAGLGPFDLIVDDASHTGSLSAITFANLWPLVRPGGWYVLEDWPVGLPSNPFYGHFEGDSMLRLAQSLIGRIRPAREITDMGGTVVPAGDPEAVIEARYIYGMAMLRKREA